MPTDCVLVKLDFTNAFNTLRRDSLLEAVARDIPELYSFAHASYSCRPMLRHGSSIIRSEEGTQQGDPMDPLEFCIALQPILSELKSELRVTFLLLLLLSHGYYFWTIWPKNDDMRFAVRYCDNQIGRAH